MIVLGFDTATPLTAVGLRLADGTTLAAVDDPDVGERPGHVTRLLPLAAGLLEQAGISWGAVERIAVGLGPGTFTGLRIGAASARGLAHSLSVELVGVSTLGALAHATLVKAAAEGGQAGSQREGASQRRGTSQRLGASQRRGASRLGVLAVIDARRGEAFAAAHDSGGELVAPTAVAPTELGAVVTRAEAASAAPAGGARRWIAVGDGARRFRETLQAAGIEVAPDDSPLHRVDAAAVCELGSRALPMTAAQIVPEYCRRPDAELALESAKR